MTYYHPLTAAILMPLALLYAFIAHFYGQWSGKLKSLERGSPPLPGSSDEKGHPENKIAIVTGCNTGIGFETLRHLVLDYGYIVILACRSRDKAEQAAAQVNKEVATTKNNRGGKAIVIQPLDLSSFDSVSDFCAEVKVQFKNKIHLLVNNAGLGGISNCASEDQFDIVFQTNFLGHFLLTSLLLEDIKACKGRIVNLSSVLHHFCGLGLNLEDASIWKDVATYGKHPIASTYNFSKLAAMLFSSELNRRYHKSSGILSIAVNPGAVNSDIWRFLPRLIRDYIFSIFMLTNEQGCRTSVAAAVLDEKHLPLGVHGDEFCCYLQPYFLPNVALDNLTTTPSPMFEVTGPYVGYRPTRPRLPPGGGHKAAAALWEACEELTGSVWPDS